MSKVRVGVLISGRGSNMIALLDTVQDAYEVVVVLSNRPDAVGLERARERGVEAIAIDHKAFGKNREAFERAVDAVLRERDVELVALAGFMRVLTPFFVGAWAERLINIHPSLLPLYPGTHTHERALAAGDREHGCTVHLVVDDVDAGPILGQARIPIIAGDRPNDLAARLLVEEHKLYPACLAAYAQRLRSGS